MRAMAAEVVQIEQTSFDIVIVAKSGFLNHSFEENKTLLAQLLTL